MLPSASDADWNRHVLIYVVAPDSSDLAHISNDLGAIALESNPLILIHSDDKLAHIRFVVSTDSKIDDRLVEACDAFIAVLDGASGVGPGTIRSWNLARDLSKPRHFAATGIVNGRVDFDELTAVATRTMEPDLLVRFLPIDSDAEDSLAGIFDVLTTDIHEVNSANVIIRASDPEHVLLTADRRNDLFDQLAHSGLDDEALANHRSGLPISVTKLEAAWSHPDTVSITPIENQVGYQVLRTWLKSLSPEWIPTLTQNDTTIDVTESSVRVGIAITESLARMWSEKDTTPLVAWNETQTITPNVQFEDEVILITEKLEPGMTLSAAPRNCELVAPIFD